MSEGWEHPFLNANDLNSQFDALHLPGTSSELYPSSYTTTPATHPTFSYTIPTAYHNQTTYPNDSGNSGSQAYSATGYTSTSQQARQNLQSATGPTTAASSFTETHDRLQQSLSQLPPGSHEHTQCLSAYYKLRVQLLAALCKQAIDTHQHVDPGSEANRKEWERQFAMHVEGTVEYNDFALKYIDWYTNWLNALRTVLFDSDNEEGDDSTGNAHGNSHAGLEHVSSRDKDLRKVYRCPFYDQGCQTAPTRKADLERHIDAVHKKSSFYFCQVTGCNRSDKPDGRGGFSRKDHMIEHYRTVHQMMDQYPKKQNLKKDAGEGSSRKKRR